MFENLDHILLDSFKRGENCAFKEIYNLYFSRLYVFALGMIKSKQEAEEIVSDSFNILFKKHIHFETLPRIRAFLYITTKNSCLNLIAYKKRRRIKVVELVDNIQDDINIEISEIEGEMMTALYSAINTLPGQCKKIMILLYYRGIAPEAIAKHLNISVQTVYSQKRRAVTLLKNALSIPGSNNILILLNSLMVIVKHDHNQYL